jgi:hypothetical protein
MSCSGGCLAAWLPGCPRVSRYAGTVRIVSTSVECQSCAVEWFASGQPIAARHWSGSVIAPTGRFKEAPLDTFVTH